MARHGTFEWYLWAGMSEDDAGRAARLFAAFTRPEEVSDVFPQVVHLPQVAEALGETDVPDGALVPLMDDRESWIYRELLEAKYTPNWHAIAGCAAVMISGVAMVAFGFLVAVWLFG